MSASELTTVTTDPQPQTLASRWTLNGRFSEENEPRTIVVEPIPFRIGRKPGLSLTLPRQTISGVHAEFLDVEGRLILRDLSSRNGTFVNGQRLTGEAVIREGDLVQFADAPFRVSQQGSEHLSHTRSQDSCNQALALVQFDRFLEGRGLIPHFQPIVDLSNQGLVAFEVLARSRLIGLETPEFMFNAALQLGMTIELSRMMRTVGLNEGSQLPNLPHLFLNTHPRELTSPGLLESLAELRRQAPHQKLTIEIHEAAVTEVGTIADLRRDLDALDMTLAFDDFGAGQARIAELSEVRPHYLKFDRCLIRNLHGADVSRRRLLSGLVTMVSDLGIVPLAEGVESLEEGTACRDIGFELAQGYYYGRPMPATHYAASGLQ